MKAKLLALLLVIVSVSAFSQEYIFGKVKSEFGNEIADAIVINVRKDEKVLSDRDGNFMIASKPTDELRIVKSGVERFHVKITSENFTQPLNVTLTKVPYLIPEVEIAFLPTGNIGKDSKSLYLTLIHI